MFNLVGFGQLVFILNIRLKETSAYFDYDPDIDWKYPIWNVLNFYLFIFFKFTRPNWAYIGDQVLLTYCLLQSIDYRR